MALDDPPRKTPHTRRRSDGAGWIWCGALALALILLLAATLGGLIVANSLDALWPHRLDRVRLADGSAFLGIALAEESAPDGSRRRQYKVANRDLNHGADFRWVNVSDIARIDRPENAVLAKRAAEGDFYGLFEGIVPGDCEGASRRPEALPEALAHSRAAWNREGRPMADTLERLGAEWNALRLQRLAAAYDLAHAATIPERDKAGKRLAALETREAKIKAESEDVLAKLNAAKQELANHKARFRLAGDSGATVDQSLPDLVDAWYPNRMGVFGRTARFVRNGWSLLADNPREANTDGGLFPALFGTALLVLIMSASAFPLGVAAGVYLREYAKDTWASRAARIAVNNLAGVPSIVFGIFGLGFFVYGLGGGIDRLFYPERVEAGISTFGTGGILWSSLTLGLLTLPVVIVATEEALSSVPSELRQGSLALGATKFQTLKQVLLPVAAPGILTGFILAMARAAGEVAPLMLTGAVKSAPLLALDGAWPYLHLDRKFMHLGFHIYDMGFQSPNVEASKPMVYLTALVLLVLVFALNALAFRMRSLLAKRYALKGL